MMKVMLVGSFSFATEMLRIKPILEEYGHTVLTTNDIELYVKNPHLKSSFEDELKIVRLHVGSSEE